MKENSKSSSQIAGGDRAVSRDEDLALFLRWTSNQIKVKAPKLKAGFEDGLRGAYYKNRSLHSGRRYMLVVPHMYS